MVDGLAGFGRLGRGLVESVTEDRFDAAVAAAVDGQRPCGGRFQAGVAVALGQALEPDAGAVGLLGMPPGEDGGDEGDSVRSDLTAGGSSRAAQLRRRVIGLDRNR